MAAKLTAEQRLYRAVVAIMADDRYIALAGVMMIGTRSVTDEPFNFRGDPMTAVTNGRDEIYGRAFVDVLSDPQLRFLVLHETYHKLYQHTTTWKWMYAENSMLANAAADFVVNGRLLDEIQDGFATMTGALQGGCYDTKYSGWNTAQVYADLKKRYPDANNGGKGNSKGSSGLGDPIDAHDWDGAEALSETEKQELGREIDQALRQGALLAGKSGSGGDRTLEELLTPQVDWREALREFVFATCQGSDYSTWRRPNRRFVSDNFYLPSGISEQISELIFAIDTSGSIGGPQLSAFLTEVKSVVDTVHPTGVRLLYWDTAVCRDEYYPMAEADNLVTSTKPAGGGGTMVECVPAYIAKNGLQPQAVIILTDGYLGGGWGNWAHPTLWCILDNKSAVADNGVTVHIESRDL